MAQGGGDFPSSYSIFFPAHHLTLPTYSGKQIKPRQTDMHENEGNKETAHLFRPILAKKPKKKQHPDFASGHPRHYYPGPSVLIFSKRNGIRRSTLVWPFLADFANPLFTQEGCRLKLSSNGGCWTDYDGPRYRSIDGSHFLACCCWWGSCCLAFHRCWLLSATFSRCRYGVLQGRQRRASTPMKG
jgi:hypothetical protein